MRTPPGAPGASSSGTRDPETLAAEMMQPTAPEAVTPNVSGGRGEITPNCSPQPGTPKVIPSSASLVAPRAGRHVQCFGRLCVDFEELRKRKGSPSGTNIFGPLKRRKYIAVDV